MFDKEVLKFYEESGLISKRSHPHLPISIYNYTKQCQYSQAWDEVTLNCRGLILDNNQNVIGKPFKKFFNIEENKHKETKDFEIFDKLDGSMILACMFDSYIIFASRGSFTSEHALEANNIYKKLNIDLNFNNIHTYIFELISPKFRVVVDYGSLETLYLLSSFDNNLNELSYQNHQDWPNIVKRYDGVEDYEELKWLNNKNAEGYVVRFSNGDRCKIKFEDYLRLHKQITNCSTTSIYDCLRSGDNLESILENVPDEFYYKVKEIENNLREQYRHIEDIACTEYQCIKNLENRREFAEKALTNRHVSDILFAMRDGKPYEEIIWKKLKPEYRKV